MPVAMGQRFLYTSSMGTLTAAIAAAVKASDQTPYAIAKGAGVARSQLSRLLSGERGLNTDTIERLADYLGYRITIEPKAPAGGKARKGR
jgi:transcriptional regulator with XRE-family HTH domain